MRVLLASHTSTVGGAERSLLTLVEALPERVSAALACPVGDLADAAAALGVRTERLAGTEMSFRLHPWHTPRGASVMVRDAITLRGAARRLRADLVHANSVRAGLVAGVASRLGGPPALVHVRDCLPAGRAADLTRRAVTASAAMVLANSRYTAAAFAAGASGPPIRVAHNAVDLRAFDPAAITRAEARARLGLPSADYVLGVVAQITPWKGQDDAIRACALVRRAYPGTRLLLVGSAKFAAREARHDNAGYLSDLRALAFELGLGSSVTFLGEREDVPALLRAMDVVLVPSWEEPFGRVVIEAMAMGTPVIATEVGGPAEVIEDGRNGVLLPPRSPERWANAILSLAGDPDLRTRLAHRGRLRSAAFSPMSHARTVVSAYEEVVSSGPRAFLSRAAV